MKEKIGILSLGCPRNLVDSENLLGRLDLKGYRIVDMDQADIAIVNTCAFIEDAKRESIDAILGLLELKKEGRLKKVIVYGCLSQRYQKQLRKDLPQIDAVVGKISLNHEVKRFSLTPRHFTYLKICEGCINNCSFCVIPKIKGKFTSLDIETILKKTALFNQEKVSELNIIGQDITGYGYDFSKTVRLPGLLKKIIKNAPDIRWIRLLYLNPERINEELIKLIKDEPKICKYIDLPLQHINSRILKLMRRKGDRAKILKLIEKIRKTIPGVGLRTALIVGFPSETDKEFRELLKFMEEVKFERLGAFTYSREEDTAAYNFKKQVPERIKEERFNRLMLLQQKISEEVNRGFLGKTLEVLVDEKQDDIYLGRTQYDAPEVDGSVYIQSKRELKPGDFVRVKINDTLEYDLAGEAI